MQINPKAVLLNAVGLFLIYMLKTKIQIGLFLAIAGHHNADMNLAIAREACNPNAQEVLKSNPNYYEQCFAYTSRAPTACLPFCFKT